MLSRPDPLTSTPWDLGPAEPDGEPHLDAAAADLGAKVLLPAFQMSYLIHSPRHVEPLLLRLDLLEAKDAHQHLGHLAPPCSPRLLSCQVIGEDLVGLLAEPKATQDPNTTTRRRRCRRCWTPFRLLSL